MRLEEGIRQAAANNNIVRNFKHFVDYSNFILNLGAAYDRRERTLRVVKRFAQYFKLSLHEKTGYCRQQMCNAFSRCVRAVSGAESVVNE
ncbi:hypothetical protein D3C78_839300 [compost metagenome]